MFDEALPLFKKHWLDFGYFKDPEFNPDKDRYIKIEQAGSYSFFTARKNSDLVGYNGFVKSRSLHNPKSLHAIQDVIYIDKNHRGFGYEFMKFCDSSLKLEAVNVIYQATKVKRSFGKILERQGYELIDHVYGRKLCQD